MVRMDSVLNFYDLEHCNINTIHRELERNLEDFEKTFREYKYHA